MAILQTSKYTVFCRVVELGSFSLAAEELGYTQSSVSQKIQSLEEELGVTLLLRQKNHLELTADGETLYPFIHAIYAAEQNLSGKKKEIEGLESSTICIAAWASVNRLYLPVLMKTFQEKYPSVEFKLLQGGYEVNAASVKRREADLGFISTDTAEDLEYDILYQDELLAVLPPGHPLAKKKHVSVRDLAREPFILLDELGYSYPLAAFQAANVTPQNLKLTVYDDYAVMEMVRQGLGVSMLYERILRGFDAGLAVRPIKEQPKRTVAVCWKDRKTLSLAARTFLEHIEHSNIFT